MGIGSHRHRIWRSSGALLSPWLLGRHGARIRILCSVAHMGALNVGIAEEGIVTGRFFYARKKRAYARSETRT